MLIKKETIFPFNRRFKEELVTQWWKVEIAFILSSYCNTSLRRGLQFTLEMQFLLVFTCCINFYFTIQCGKVKILLFYCEKLNLLHFSYVGPISKFTHTRNAVSNNFPLVAETTICSAIVTISPLPSSWILH